MQVVLVRHKSTGDLTQNNSLDFTRYKSVRSPTFDNFSPAISNSDNFTFSNTTSFSIKRRATSMTYISILNNISDFNNKDQINEAIHRTNNAKDRIKLIDLIIKRKEEINAMERQMKLEKAAPMLLRFAKNFKKKFHEKRRGSSLIISRSSLSTISGNNNSKTPMTDILKKVVIETPRELKQKLIPGTPESLRSRAQRTPVKPSIKIQLAEKARESPKEEIDRKELIRKRANEATVLMKQKEEKNITHTPKIRNYGSKSKESSPEKSNNQSMQSRSMTNLSSKMLEKRPLLSKFEIGSKTLEKDLFKFLVKNEKKEEADHLIKSFETGHEKLIKNIESKVKQRIDQADFQKHQFAYFLPHSYAQKSEYFERTKYITDACKCLSNQTSKERLKIKQALAKEYPVRSSALIRRNNIKYSVLEKELSGSKGSLLDPEREPDDSFISYTETKLDELYKKGMMLSNQIQILDSKVIESYDERINKKLEKKLEAFQENMIEIKKLTKRKVK